ncbi:hypothetical protein [Colwellia sp. MB02u-6]|nr:hypothetical protein [Colwellia sp. MB02u-6]
MLHSKYLNIVASELFAGNIFPENTFACMLFTRENVDANATATST